MDSISDYMDHYRRYGDIRYRGEPKIKVPGLVFIRKIPYFTPIGFWDGAFGNRPVFSETNCSLVNPRQWILKLGWSIWWLENSRQLVGDELEEFRSWCRRNGTWMDIATRKIRG